MTKQTRRGIVIRFMRELRLEIPDEIDVVLPPKYAEIPTITKFFRGGSYLPLGLRLAKERAGEGVPLSVRSVACSNGAEVDSILGLHRKSGDEREVTVTGYDINDAALMQARFGLYTAFGHAHARVLESFGFATDPQMHGRQGTRPMLEVDANPVREGRTVEFVEHDAREPLPVTEEAGLTFVNNLLYHLGDATAARIVRNLAGPMSDKAVLSFGTGTLAKDSPLDGDRIVGILDREFGLEPLFVDAAGTPIMFGRTL